MSDNKSKKSSNKMCKHLKTKIISKDSEGNGYGFCLNCAGIFIMIKGKTMYSIKPKIYQEAIDFDPIEMTRAMRLREENQFPYKIDESQQSEKEDKINTGKIFDSSSAESDSSDFMEEENEVSAKEMFEKGLVPEEGYKFMKLKEFDFNDKTLERYLRRRKSLLSFIQKITLQQKFGDSTFYLTLFYLDHFLSRHITKGADKKELYYIALGFLVIAAKFGESNIFEPEFSELVEDVQEFTNITLDREILEKYEYLCIGFLKFDMMNYSAYDWLMTFMLNGFIFKEEINENKSSKKVINEIYNHCTKLLAMVTGNKLFVTYTPAQIALSILKLARKDLYKEDSSSKDKKSSAQSNLSGDEIFSFILKLYGYKHSDYKRCYKDIKELLKVPESPKKQKPKKMNTLSLSNKNKKSSKFEIMLEDEEDLENRDRVDELDNDFEYKKSRGNSSKNIHKVNNPLLGSQQIPNRYQSGKVLDYGLNKLANSLNMSKITKIDSHLYIDAAPDKTLKTETSDSNNKSMNPNLNPRTKFLKPNKINTFNTSTKEIPKHRFTLTQSNGGKGILYTSAKKRASEINIPVSINPLNLEGFDNFTRIAEEAHTDDEEKFFGESVANTHIYSELEGTDLDKSLIRSNRDKEKKGHKKNPKVDNRGDADEGSMFENQHKRRQKQKFFGTKLEDQNLPSQISKISNEKYGANSKKRAGSLSKISGTNKGMFINRLKTISTSDMEYINKELKRKSTSNNRLLKLKLRGEF